MGYYEATNEGGWWSCPHCYGTINALEGVPFAPAEPAEPATPTALALLDRLERAEKVIAEAQGVLAWVPQHDGDDLARVSADYMRRAQIADEVQRILAGYEKETP